MSTKKILFIYQAWRNFNESLGYYIFSSLMNDGKIVEYLNISPPPAFKNDNYYYKLINIIRRYFFKDFEYIHKLEKKHYNKFYLRQLEEQLESEKYDWIIVLRPDEYTPSFFKTLKKKGVGMSGYIWDGIHDSWISDLKKSYKYFDKLFSFDKNDIKKYPEIPLKFLTNFYMDNLIENSQKKQNDYQFLYVGSIGSKDKNRRDFQILANFRKYLNDSKMIIQYDKDYISPKDEIKNYNIDYINDYLPYVDILDLVRKSFIIIDICKPHHRGLSFRVFESIFYEKKLITNNTEIKNYDFYNSNNILIIDYEKIEENKLLISKFINTPFVKIPEQIKINYSIQSWFEKMTS